MQLHIFPHQRNLNLPLTVPDPGKHLIPIAQIAHARPILKPQLPQGDPRKPCFLQHHRGLIEDWKRPVFDHAVLLYVAQQRDFPENRRIVHRPIHAGYDDIRHDPKGLELFYGVLGRLGLKLPGRLQVRDQSHMDKQAVSPPRFQRNLADRFQKRLGFDVARRTPDLGDHNICICLFLHGIDKGLDLVCNVRNHLDGLTQIFSLSLLI